MKTDDELGHIVHSLSQDIAGINPDESRLPCWSDICRRATLHYRVHYTQVSQVYNQLVDEHWNIFLDLKYTKDGSSIVAPKNPDVESRIIQWPSTQPL